MSEFKGTKGKWEVDLSNGPWPDEDDYSGTWDIRSGDTKIVGVSAYKFFNLTFEESKANAQLIADAGNVRQQINVDLTELLKQRDELLDMLKEAKRVICSMKLSMWVHPDCSEGSEFYDIATTGEETEDKIEQLIKEATTI